MINLLVHTSATDQDASAETRFGGRPSAPGKSLAWPSCRCCQGKMQFLGQLPRHQPSSDDGKLLLLFMCQNDPGMCSDWEADSGANKVIVVNADALELVEPADEGEVLRSCCYGASVHAVDALDYEAARVAWSNSHGHAMREVLGQLGGEPSWVQSDEVPSCDACQNPMSFFAQLEEGPDWRTAMNFGGGGSAYVFTCQCSETSAKMLWQC